MAHEMCKDFCLKPRADAQASEHSTGVGGWLPVYGHDWYLDVSESTWFTEEPAPEQYSWVQEQ